MDKVIALLKKRWWVIPVSLLLLLYATIICAIIGYFIVGITGVEWLFYFSFGIAGFLSSLPIICKVWKTDKITKNIKIVVIVLLVLLFSFISYVLLYCD